MKKENKQLETTKPSPELEATKLSPEPVAQITHVRGEKYMSTYSNYVQCAITPWDVRIEFGELGESAPNVPSVIDLVSIVVTPQLAKAIVSVIHGNLKNYEDQFGEIVMPKGLQALANKQDSDAKSPSK